MTRKTISATLFRGPSGGSFGDPFGDPFGGSFEGSFGGSFGGSFRGSFRGPSKALSETQSGALPKLLPNSLPKALPATLPKALPATLSNSLPKALSAILALALLLLALPLAACNNADKPGDNTPNPAAISVVDMTGRTVTLDKPAERVVALTASTCEIVYALGSGDTVVGRGEYCNWPAEALNKPSVASGAETNIEQIIALKPDLVLMDSMDQTPEQVKQLENAGIKVYASSSHNIADTYESILQIGHLMGKDSQAQAIVDNMKKTFDELSAKKVSGTVYFEVSPLEYGLWTAGNGTFMNEVAELIGLKNIFSDLNGWAEVSEEQVLQRNPDYIVTVGMFFGEGLTPTEEILARKSWQNITAVKNNRILNLSNDELSRPGPRLAEGAQSLYNFVSGK